MVDLKRLNAIIEESGMKLDVISKKAGMKPYTLSRRLAGHGEFTASEIAGVTRALRLKMSERNEIFLR